MRKCIISIVLLALLTPAVSLAALPEKGADGIVFTYTAPEAGAVFLAGDFNGWNASDLPLVKSDDGVWSISVTLDSGVYEYKYIVDGNWLEDPANPEKVQDPFGGSNSKLTVKADGSVIGAGVAASTPATKAKPTATGGKHKVGAPKALDGGVLFTYDGKSASTVHLAGTFNGWNATDTPLARGENGVWSVVKDLPAGEHEYKFVVDGAWFADPANPDTKADPYGGANSLVTLDDSGNLIESAGGDSGGGTTANTSLNARLNLNGRYLTRMETARGVLGDPRYRMQRPRQTVDLNFDTQVSDVAETYMRIRLDSESNLIQNNVAGFLDEAGLTLHPDKFSLEAYLNQEAFSSADIIAFIGDIDHPATPGYDHLEFGKGTAGAVFEAHPWGVKTSGFFANVHNADYYNDPDLFDNLGKDIMGVRFSRQVGRFEFAVPAFLERDLVWLDFNEIVSQPSTGIPVLDEHRSNTDDSSTWYESDNLLLRGGLEVYYNLTEDWSLGTQLMRGNDKQRFVTGNESGENNSNGALDLVFYDRDNTWVALCTEYRTAQDRWVLFKHIRTDFSGASPQERYLSYTFQDQATANKNIYFDLSASPPEIDVTRTEVEGAWNTGDWDLGIWAWLHSTSADYGVAGATVPGDSTRTENDPHLLYISGKAAYGSTDERFGRAELEFGLTFGDPDLKGATSESQELILRCERDLTPKTAAIADIRHISYQLAEGGKPGYWSPFIGVKHEPIRNLELVLGYGVDPLDFSIDYSGRQFGRWWYRQNYLFENPEATLQDAEQALEDARVITLRAQFIF